MKIIPLNIMMSYPVKWGKQQVLRDIVQNFYDDAGFNEFGKKFNTLYDADKNEITLSMLNDGFSYEWLMHMGASTKQREPGKYAGFFGEGFKVAALCAIRDYNWIIKMRSRNWALDVVALDMDIEGNFLQQLAYQLEDELLYSSETSLTIGNASSEDAKLLDDIIMGFYYPENPLLGRCIFKNSDIAIYERSNIPKPKHFPSGLKVYGDGIVFISFQARSAFVKPLVLCNHRFKTPERERYDIYLGTILDVLLDMVDSMNGITCCYLLEQLEKYWYDYPASQEDVDCWYCLIRKLIRKIVYAELTTNLRDDFVNRHPNLVVCEHPTNMRMRNQKTQALAWRKHYLPESRLVQDSFRMFGYETIVNICDKAGGFNSTRIATDSEQELLTILESAAKEIYGNFFNSYPPCRIIENESSIYNGTASMLKKIQKEYNPYGHRVRYTLEHIEIKKTLMAKDHFAQAFSTYCHELCHCFGADVSASFSLALTDAMALAAANTECLQRYNHKWTEFFISPKQKGERNT